MRKSLIVVLLLLILVYIILMFVYEQYKVKNEGFDFKKNDPEYDPIGGVGGLGFL